MRELINEVLESLQRRGFYHGANPHAVMPQAMCVLEEVGEVARLLRREAQGQPPRPEKVAWECADVFIASVCLSGTLIGNEIPFHNGARPDYNVTEWLGKISSQAGLMALQPIEYQREYAALILNNAWHLLIKVVGEASAPELVRYVCRADEERGWLHSSDTPASSSPAWWSSPTGAAGQSDAPQWWTSGSNEAVG